MTWKAEASSRLPELLEKWLRRPVVRAEKEGTDIALRSNDLLFIIEVRGSDDIGTLDRAAASLPLATPKRIPLVAVPYMGPKARAWATERGLLWVDLSGNADIRADGLCVVVSGEPNRYASPGRPSNPFTPAYSRVSRALLVDADRWWKQAEVAEEVSLPPGTVSKAVQRLDSLKLIERNPFGAVRARVPSVLLDSWAQRYRFSGHAVRRYHTVSRSGPETLEVLAGRFTEGGITCAATGMSAAWLLTRFADFRINTFFVTMHPRDPSALGLRPVERGENVWLAVPKDDGVWYGHSVQDLWCVHPVQVYLDLLGHPERADDAARELRTQLLQWRT